MPNVKGFTLIAGCEGIFSFGLKILFICVDARKGVGAGLPRPYIIGVQLICPASGNP